jgi:hypothetical protein
MKLKTTLLRGIIIAAIASLTAAHADHMSLWGPGWANMPNDIHNTRIDTRGDNDAFLDFVMYGDGADSTNRFLTEETAALESALASGHQVDQLAARLDPLPGFLGGGWARYTLFDDETLVNRVLNINIRLRLIQQDGSLANETLGLTADNADDADTSVSAYFSRYTADGDRTDYAKCSLVFVEVIVGEDDVPDYATYGLSLKEDQDGVIDGTGACAEVSADASDTPMLPSIQLSDVVEVGVRTPVIEAEIQPVLMGSF